MLRLRPYRKCDAQHILGWLKDEVSFRKWSADRYDRYPATADDMNEKYDMSAQGDNSFEMTAFDEGGVVGHLTMRFTDDEKQVLRFGFIVVDDSKRGKGYGKEMLTLALKYAYDILKVKKVTLGVFENNPSAMHCYESVGFRSAGKSEICRIMDEDWLCIEMEHINSEGLPKERRS